MPPSMPPSMKADPQAHLLRPPQRVGPRPLPLHMAMEGWILQTSFAGLIASKSASPFSSPTGLLDPLLNAVAGKNPTSSDAGLWSAALQPLPLIDAVTREAKARMESFVHGVRSYQAHPHRRTLTPPPAVWRHGVASVLDYGGPADGPPTLFVPSLINRAYILDLAEDRSLMRASAALGLRSFLLDPQGR